MGYGRILQVITDTDRRGAQVFAMDLHEALIGRGRAVRTVALAPGWHGDLLDVPVLARSWPTPQALTALRAEMTRAHVVVAHGSSTLPACAIAGASTRTPFIYRQISDSLFWANTRGRRLRVRASLRRARAVVALWPGAARVLTDSFGVASDRVHVIPNGVPAVRFPPINLAEKPAKRARLGLRSDVPTLLYMGALVPEKGVDAAIRAVAMFGECQLLVVGSGAEEPALRRLAARVAPGWIVFCGPTRNPAEFLAAADLIVLPSRGGDSMPGILIEAALSGLPAVSTTIGGIPAIICDGVTGRTVAPDDDAGLLAAIRDALDNASTYGAVARQYCLQEFEIDSVASRWDQMLSRFDSLAVGR